MGQQLQEDDDTRLLTMEESGGGGRRVSSRAHGALCPRSGAMPGVTINVLCAIPRAMRRGQVLSIVRRTSESVQSDARLPDRLAR
jgi:hypothetical protein